MLDTAQSEAQRPSGSEHSGVGVSGARPKDSSGGCTEELAWEERSDLEMQTACVYICVTCVHLWLYAHVCLYAHALCVCVHVCAFVCVRERA